jgi:hypothetical protein
MQTSIPLLAGQETRITAQCRALLVKSTGAAATVDLQVEFAGNIQREEFGAVERGFKFRLADPASPAVQTVVLTAPINCTVVLIHSRQNIDINLIDGAAVVATLDVSQLPLQVANDKGAAGNPVYVSGITYSDAPAITLQDNAAIAVTSAGAALVAANANRKSMRLTNIGTDPVAVGFTGITWAKRCLVLNAGDTWLEDRAANLAWAAITDAGKNASVTVQEVRV